MIGWSSGSSYDVLSVQAMPVSPFYALTSFPKCAANVFTFWIETWIGVHIDFPNTDLSNRTSRRKHSSSLCVCSTYNEIIIKSAKCVI